MGSQTNKNPAALRRFSVRKGENMKATDVKGRVSTNNTCKETCGGRTS